MVSLTGGFALNVFTVGNDGCSEVLDAFFGFINPYFIPRNNALQNLPSLRGVNIHILKKESHMTSFVIIDEVL
jgi:hypothetical protein